MPTTDLLKPIDPLSPVTPTIKSPDTKKDHLDSAASQPASDAQVTEKIANNVPAADTAPATTAVEPPMDPATTDTNVNSQLNRVLDTNSPLIQRARAKARQEANRRGLLNSSIAVKAGETAAIDAALPIAAQQAYQAQQSKLQSSDISSREMIASLDREAQERIANLNVAAHDREKATAAVATVSAVYGDMYKSIASNENLPADVRDQYLTHISLIRDQNINLLEQLYDFDLVWEQTPTETTPAA